MQSPYSAKGSCKQSIQPVVVDRGPSETQLSRLTTQSKDVARKLTTAEFVFKAKLIHGNLYDYSKTEYVRSNDKVEISCLEHGPFWMTPGNHTHRTKPQGCPTCGRKRSDRARNKTTEEFLIEVADVHGDRYGLSLVDYKKAKEKVKIVCEKHGEFKISPDHFLKGQGCKKCGVERRSKARATPERGKSLLDLHPDLCEEWSDFNVVRPSECRPGSSRSAFWECRKCANKWWAPINARVNGRGCRVCIKGRLHSSGSNSMFHTHPELAAEMMPNPHGTAKTLTAGTNELLPWKCSVCEHEWVATGGNRKQGKGCRPCKVGTLHSDGRNSMARTHPHLAKELLPNEFGTAEEIVAGMKEKLPWKCSVCDNEWIAYSYSRAHQETGCPACANQSLHSDGRNSMARTHPRLAKELMPNEFGTAEILIAGSNTRLPWKCATCGHEWKTTGNNRVMGSMTNCPACANQTLHMDGLNSIASKLPDIAHELMPNPFGTAETIIYVSTEKLPWKCSTCGHEWKTMGRNRARGTGCPPCTRGDLHSDGSNSMANTHPLLAKELLPNQHGTAETLIAGTNKILPWKCSSCEYEWETTGAHRSFEETGCPKCAIHGFQPHLPAQYYVHEIRNAVGDIVFYKGGISGDWIDRLRHLESNLSTHLRYNNIEVIYFDLGKNARKLEKKLLAVEEIRAPKREFDGGSELFTENPLNYAREIGLIKPNELTH